MTQSLYELVGRKQEAIENLQLEYAKLLNLVRWLKSGEATLDRVTVDGDSWNLAPAAKPVEEPSAEE